MKTQRSRLLLMVVAAACGGASGDADTDATDSADVTGSGDSTMSGGPSTTAGPSSGPSTDPSDDSSDSDPDTGTEDTTGGVDEVAAMCGRWLADRADMSEGAWSGDVVACNAGDIEAAARERSLRLLNLHRWLADLPPITTSPELDAKNQACALMMAANGTLSHTPPPDWACYGADGAEGAGNSNIASAPAVSAIDLYMIDPGNPDTIGHRRWILSNSIGPTGIGSTDQSSCLWTLGGSGSAGAPWIAFPPPGPFPLSGTTIGWTSLDETGWTIQSDSIDMNTAQVEVTRDGEPLAMQHVPLLGGYGSASAISLVPMGWQHAVGDYHVVVTGISEPIEYDVQIVDCGG